MVITCDFQAQNLKIFMPFANRTLVGNPLDYTELNTGVWISQSAGYSNAEGEIAKFQWLNKANPDWEKLAAAPPQTIFGMSGEFTYPTPSIISANFSIVQGANLIDKWWGSTIFGKYGVASPGFGPNYQCPVTFINFPQSIMQFEDYGWNTLYTNFQPGVIANVSWSPSTMAGTLTPTPPIYWYMANPTWVADGNLSPGATPASIYGPEVLP